MLPRGLAIVASVVGLGLGLAGCPRDPAVVDRPASATPCSSDADCNPAGVSCGLLRACVDERCEGQATRTVHCP